MDKILKIWKKHSSGLKDGHCGLAKNVLDHNSRIYMPIVIKYDTESIR